MKQKILLILRAAMSIALMTVLIYIMRDSIPKMLEAIKNMPLHIWFAGFLLFVTSIFIVSLRLKILLAAHDIFLSLLDIVKLSFVGYFFSSFLPTSVGGDVVKAFYISKISDKTMQSYAAVFIDRFLGMSTIFLIATGAFFYTKEIPKSYLRWFLPMLLAVSAVFLICLFNKKMAKSLSLFIAPLVPRKIHEKLKDAYESMHNLTRKKSDIMACMLISIVGQLTAFSAAYVFARGMSSYVPLKFVLLAMPVASIVSMLPSIYGMGPREMSIALILSPIVGKDKALAIALLWLAILLAIALIGGIIHAFMGRYKIIPEKVFRSDLDRIGKGNGK